jgi:tRNA (guanine-N7-)-methyltransferase
MDKSRENTVYQRKVRSYILRQGRMSGLQQRAYSKHFPRFSIGFCDTLIDFGNIYENRNPVVIEIGFGMGTTTALIAEENPSINYLGIEVFSPGIGKLLDEIDRKNLKNIRIIQHDAVEVFESMIPEASISGIHIFFPDPWPKKKHHKRRLINDFFIDLAAGKLKDTCYIYAVTDWEDYAQQIINVLTSSKYFDNQYKGYALPQGWRPETKFEIKGLNKNHKIKEIYFTRNNL